MISMALHVQQSKDVTGSCTSPFTGSSCKIFFSFASLLFAPELRKKMVVTFGQKLQYLPLIYLC